MARLGFVGAIAGTIVGLILLALDGLATKQPAEAWATAFRDWATAVRLVQTQHPAHHRHWQLVLHGCLARFADGTDSPLCSAARRISFSPDESSRQPRHRNLAGVVVRVCATHLWRGAARHYLPP
jgi:hypothetical protein